MAKKSTIEHLQDEMLRGFTRLEEQIAALRSEVRDDLRHVRKDILAIHSDLIKHDERADKMLDILQGRPGTKEIRVE